MTNFKSLDVLDPAGKKSGSVKLPNNLFAVETNVSLIHQVVVAQLAAARQGTHSTKTRGEVSGGGKKPWRQKGTGRARQGSIRAPQWTGGGVVHGPQPRSYAQRTPKKMISGAILGALSDRVRESKLFVVESLVTGDKPSTKAALTALSAIGEVAKSLVVLDREDELSWLSVRNLPEVHVIAVDQLNAYDIVNAEQIIFTKTALEMFIAAKSYSENETAAKAPKTVKKAAVKADSVENQPYGADSFQGENPPAEFEIKGKIKSQKYYTSEDSGYGRVVAEVWFRTAEAAVAAGFVSASNKAEKTEENSK